MEDVSKPGIYINHNYRLKSTQFNRKCQNRFQEELVWIDTVNRTKYQPFDCAQAVEGRAQDQSLPAAGSLSFRLSLRPDIRLRVHVEGLTFKFYEISTSK